MVVSDNHTPSTKRRRCLIGEERKLEGPSLSETADLTTTETITEQQQQTRKQVCTIFIGGLHPRIVEAHLEKMCMPYGSIQRLHLMQRKGYAFCQYATPEQAEAAMQALDGRGLLGRRLMVRPAHNDQQHNNSSNPNNRGASTTATGSAAAETSSANPEKERERIEARIQAVKRKLQEAQTR